MNIDRIGGVIGLCIVVGIAALGVAAYGGERRTQPIEVGDVQWGRDFDGTLAASAASGKPVLLLFQEVPG